MKKIIIFLLALTAILLVLGCTQQQNTTDANTITGSEYTTNQVTIQGFAFMPKTVIVPLDTTVVWTNRDAVTHAIVSNDGLFDSGNRQNGTSYSFTFTRAGTYNYYCKLHPEMKGTIIVK